MTAMTGASQPKYLRRISAPQAVPKKQPWHLPVLWLIQTDLQK